MHIQDKDKLSNKWKKKLHVYRNKSRVGQQLFTATVKTLEELDKY